MLGLHSVFLLVGYNPVLCLLAFKRSQEVNGLHYIGNGPVFRGYEFRTGQVLDITPLQVNKRLNTGFSTVADVSCRQYRWVSDQHFARIESCEAVWREFSSVAG